MHDICIIGSGPAGLTAGIYAVRAGYTTLLISGVRWGGQLMLTTLVENFPGFFQGIQGPDLMMEMRKQAERLGVEILAADATGMDVSTRPFLVHADGKSFPASCVILATGADSLWLGVPGEAALRGKGVSSCATCDAFFFRGKHVAVVGGGDSAMEEALVLAKVAASVTLIHRKSAFRASHAMQQRVFGEKKIRILWNTEVVRMLGDTTLSSLDLRTSISGAPLPFRIDGRDTAIDRATFVRTTVSSLWNGTIREETDDALLWNFPVSGVFLAIGHVPNSRAWSGLELDAKGYIVRKQISTDQGTIRFQSATNIPGVFVSGDVYDYRYRQAITAAGSGCIAALDAVTYLEEEAVRTTRENTADVNTTRIS